MAREVITLIAPNGGHHGILATYLFPEFDPRCVVLSYGYALAPGEAASPLAGASASFRPTSSEAHAGLEVELTAAGTRPRISGRFNFHSPILRPLRLCHWISHHQSGIPNPVRFPCNLGSDVATEKIDQFIFNGRGSFFADLQHVAGFADFPAAGRCRHGRRF